MYLKTILHYKQTLVYQYLQQMILNKYLLLLVMMIQEITCKTLPNELIILL